MQAEFPVEVAAEMEKADLGPVQRMNWECRLKEDLCCSDYPFEQF